MGLHPDEHVGDPFFEISAEFPIYFRECVYNQSRGGIQISLVAGRQVPLDRLSASLTPEPRSRVAGTEFSAEPEGTMHVLRALVPCDQPQADVTLNVQFDETHIASSTVLAEKSARDVWGKDGSGTYVPWMGGAAAEVV